MICATIMASDVTMGIMVSLAWCSESKSKASVIHEITDIAFSRHVVTIAILTAFFFCVNNRLGQDSRMVTANFVGQLLGSLPPCFAKADDLFLKWSQIRII